MKKSSKAMFIFSIIYLGLMSSFIFDPEPKETPRGEISATTYSTPSLVDNSGPVFDQSTPLPKRKIDPNHQEITLWSNIREADSIEVDGVPAKSFLVDQELLESFHIGQEIHLFLPESDTPLTSVINHTYSQFDGVKIWRSASSPHELTDALTIVKGSIETHITIHNELKSFTAIIDNQTGKTTLIDEASWRKNQSDSNDVVIIPLQEETLPRL